MSAREMGFDDMARMLAEAHEIIAEADRLFARVTAEEMLAIDIGSWRYDTRGVLERHNEIAYLVLDAIHEEESRAWHGVPQPWGPKLYDQLSFESLGWDPAGTYTGDPRRPVLKPGDSMSFSATLAVE